MIILDMILYSKNIPYGIVLYSLIEVEFFINKVKRKIANLLVIILDMILYRKNIQHDIVLSFLIEAKYFDKVELTRT